VAPSTQIKEEFYVRHLFNDDVPVFVDATKYIRQDLPYLLSAKKSLKATCGVRTDTEVVAFSLRSYTGRPEAAASLRAATTGFPGLAANPHQAEVRSTQPEAGVPVA
jgi:hypothetical protein